MSKEQEVKDIIAQLQRLQLDQATLISRLERLSENVPNTFSDATREFAVGDRVQIKNPGVLQVAKGTIVRIGARITVLTDNNKKVVRASKNLT